MVGDRAVVGDVAGRFESPNGFITPDGRQLWNNITLSGALAGAALMGVAGAITATVVSATRRGHAARAALAGTVVGGAVGSVIGGAAGWLLGGLATLKAESDANQKQGIP